MYNGKPIPITFGGYSPFTIPPHHEPDPLKILTDMYFTQIVSEQSAYQKLPNPPSQQNIDKSLAEALLKELEGIVKPVQDEDRKAIAAAIASIGRLSLIEATKEVWQPAVKDLDPITELVLGVSDGTFCENLDRLERLDFETLTEQTLRIVLTNIFTLAIQKKEFASLQQYADKFSQYVERVRFDSFKHKLFNILSDFPREIYADPEAKNSINTYLEAVVKKAHPLDYLPFVLTLRFKGFLDCEFVNSDLEKRLESSHSTYEKNYGSLLHEDISFLGDEQTKDLVNLIKLTFGKYAVEFNANPKSKELQQALDPLIQTIISIPNEDKLNRLIPSLETALAFSPPLFQFLLENMALGYLKRPGVFADSKQIMQKLLLPLTEKMDFEAFEAYNDFILSMLMSICRYIKSEPASSASVFNLQLVERCQENFFNKLPPGSLQKSKDQLLECFQEAGKHIFRDLLKNINLNFEWLGSRIGVTIAKVAPHGINYKDPALEKFIIKLAETVPINEHYRQLSLGVSSSPTITNPTTIWYLSEYCEHATHLAAEDAQVLCDSVFMKRNIEIVLRQKFELDARPYYFKLFSTLKEKNPDLLVDSAALSKFLSYMDEVYKTPDSNLFIVLADFLKHHLISETFIEPKKNPKGILKKVGVREKPANIAIGNHVGLQVCITLERWLKSAKGTSSPEVLSRMESFAKYLTENCPANLNVFACAEPIFPHYPEMAMQIMQNALDSRCSASLKPTVTSLLDAFKETTSKIDINYEEWNRSAKKVMLVPGLNEREQRFLNDLYIRLKRMFPQPQS